MCPVAVLCEGACVMHRDHQPPIAIARLQQAREDVHPLEEHPAGKREVEPVVEEHSADSCCLVRHLSRF